MPDSVKDLFSEHSELYAKYRPLYPKELFEFIIQFVKEKNRALDCGTGNGQAAGILSEYFKEVHGTDISENQIANAVKKTNINYHICKAEATPFAENSFDLITTATALHWFNFDDFFKEIKRVGKNNAAFACWAYSVLKTDHFEINKLISEFYNETVHSFWNAERHHVDEQYKNIPFPFREIKNSGFATHLKWNLTTLEGYLNTWSAVQNFIKIKKVNPVNEIINEMRKKCGDEIILKITFPIFLRIGIIEK
jgi:ubiquinone/menaquinone biosynthesis C-methylase UbiE